MEDILQKIYAGFGKSEGNIITLLQDIQREFGYIPEAAVNWFSKKLDIPEGRFFGVATFYSQFHLKPRGKHIITTCCGTACHVKGAERILDSIVSELSLPEGEQTTPDRQFTIEKVNCVGACSIAPVVLIDDKVHGKVSAEGLVKDIRDMKTGEEKA